MAAWYIFNSLGFYPVRPGTGEYVIGIPLIDQGCLDFVKWKSIDDSCFT